MISFQLHDGADERKTENLHVIMEALFKGTPHEWEGDNSGITIYLRVSPGDEILVEHSGAIRILPKDAPVKIMRSTFPMTYDAMLGIEIDNGAQHVNRIHGPGTVELQFFEMPFSYGVAKLVITETFLAALKMTSEDEFNVFVDGEETEQLAIVKKYESMGAPIAHALINDWFNGWEPSIVPS